MKRTSEQYDTGGATGVPASFVSAMARSTPCSAKSVPAASTKKPEDSAHDIELGALIKEAEEGVLNQIPWSSGLYLEACSEYVKKDHEYLQSMCRLFRGVIANAKSIPSESIQKIYQCYFELAIVFIFGNRHLAHTSELNGEFKQAAEQYLDAVSCFNDVVFYYDSCTLRFDPVLVTNMTVIKTRIKNYQVAKNVQARIHAMVDEVDAKLAEQRIETQSDIESFLKIFRQRDETIFLNTVKFDEKFFMLIYFVQRVRWHVQLLKQLELVEEIIKSVVISLKKTVVDFNVFVIKNRMNIYRPHLVIARLVCGDRLVDLIEVFRRTADQYLQEKKAAPELFLRNAIVDFYVILKKQSEESQAEANRVTSSHNSLVGQLQRACSERDACKQRPKAEAAEKWLIQQSKLEAEQRKKEQQKKAQEREKFKRNRERQRTAASKTQHSASVSSGGGKLIQDENNWPRANVQTQPMPAGSKPLCNKRGTSVKAVEAQKESSCVVSAVWAKPNPVKDEQVAQAQYFTIVKSENHPIKKDYFSKGVIDFFKVWRKKTFVVGVGGMVRWGYHYQPDDNQGNDLNDIDLIFGCEPQILIDWCGEKQYRCGWQNDRQQVLQIHLPDGLKVDASFVPVAKRDADTFYRTVKKIIDNVDCSCNALVIDLGNFNILSSEPHYIEDLKHRIVRHLGKLSQAPNKILRLLCQARVPNYQIALSTGCEICRIMIQDPSFVKPVNGTHHQLQRMLDKNGACGTFHDLIVHRVLSANIVPSRVMGRDGRLFVPWHDPSLSQQFRELIETGSVSAVDDFIAKNPDVSCYVNSSGSEKSSLEIAIEKQDSAMVARLICLGADFIGFMNRHGKPIDSIRVFDDTNTLTEQKSLCNS